MFNCAECEQTFGPAIKPVKVVLYTRPVEYHNRYFVEDEYGNQQERLVDSVGTEIVREVQLCPEDAEKSYGAAQPKPAPAGKPVVKFEEKLAPPIFNPFIAVMVHNALDRVNQTSKRARKDSIVAIPLVKFFTDMNKDYLF